MPLFSVFSLRKNGKFANNTVFFLMFMDKLFLSHFGTIGIAF